MRLVIMGRHRITQLRIAGLRAIENVTLDLKGLTVLVGDNGTGKSTILEALEILRLAARPVDFVTDVLTKRHGGLRGLLRRGAEELRLGVTIESDRATTTYDLVLAGIGLSAQVARETFACRGVDEHDGVHIEFQRKGSQFDGISSDGVRLEGLSVGATELVLSRVLNDPHSRVDGMLDAFSGIEVHVPFETRPIWQQRALDIRAGPRWPSTVERSESLSRCALDLPNAFQQLRNMGGEVWSRVVDRARLGLGNDVRDFAMPAAGRGEIELAVFFGRIPDGPLPAEYLSEGQLSYLAFLALAELHQHRSVLAFDDPELHLHPGLLARVVGLLEEASEYTPVILATHSDRLLDALADPVSSVVLCDLDENRAVRLRRPDADNVAVALHPVLAHP